VDPKKAATGRLCFRDARVGEEGQGVHGTFFDSEDVDGCFRRQKSCKRGSQSGPKEFKENTIENRAKSDPRSIRCNRKFDVLMS
jgi:hypothetical protein